MNKVTLAAPMAGWLMSVRDVPDPVFSEEMMGVGVAIDPVDGKVCAPCDAEVLLVAPTAHSVTLRTGEGAELLIHVGLETVALGRRGFEAHVREGDRVTAGDTLIAFDLDKVAVEAKSLASPIILTNPGEFSLTLAPLDRVVGRGEAIGTIEPLGAAALQTSSDDAIETAECLVGFAHGLHARPAARIADAAKRYSSQITISFGGKSALARSPTAIMALNANKGDRVTLAAAGEDRAAAIETVAKVLSSGEAETSVALAPTPAAGLAENEIAGLPAVPGAAVGTAVRWRAATLNVPEQGRGVPLEKAAFEEALTRVAAALRGTAAKVAGPASEIARAHLALLDDEDLRRAAMVEIACGKSAAYAWQSATSAAAEALRQTDNPRMQERIADLKDVGEQVARALVGKDAGGAPELPHNAVLIARDLLPSELLSLDRSRLAAIAVQRGGATSHMAIIAGSFGLPTLVAIGADLSRVRDGQQVLVDAVAGKLVVEPAADVAERALAQSRPGPSAAAEVTTRDGERVTLLANLGGISEVEGAIAAGAEGCGLLRTEFLFLDRAEAPNVEEQRACYQAIADALGGRPLTIRTLDIGGDKPVPFIDFGREENPALGARGVRISLVRAELIDDQLRAIAQVQSAALKVMIPMVSSVDELRRVRARWSELAAGKPIKLGAMVETPAAALLAERLAAEADFLSIGTNDLAQYALAMDRTNALLAPLIDALHPAVLRLIALTVEAGARTGTPVSVCGNLASDPVGALLLVGLGVRELSGVPASFPLIRQALAQVTIDRCRELAARALQMESAAEVRALGTELLRGGAGE
jgi:phosphocarrier protein FPr/phosphocarrier protein